MISIEELLYGRTKCYLIDGKLLIDTDWAGTLHAFYKCLHEKNIKISHIQYLMVTHFHPDHMGLVSQLMDAGMQFIIFDVQEPYVHVSDAVFVKQHHVFFQPIDAQKALHLCCKDSRAFLKSIGIEGEVISTPAHSQDSISLILDGGAAFVGDLYPYEMEESMQDPVFSESWHLIKAHHARQIYYAHWPIEELHG
ncbi:MAG: MBL fold metallo-hydrolase [Lactimicrobium sp.]|jgi:glyoxylase-like metal-dependent hydrolase (beta-lactamase superfamily II)|uniref:MBL fold metallo-hydrolase n=1 Tax=Lactimicrobium sp. TaxID=2563780 RepID=UPI002F356292